MLDIITIGDVTIDTFCILNHKEADVSCNVDKSNCQLNLNYADKIPIQEIYSTMGGNAPNAAVSAARLGLDTSIIADIGTDEPSRNIALTLEKENIDLKYITRHGKTNQSIAIIYDGERTMLVHREERDYHFGEPTPARWLYLSSLAEGGEKILDDVLRYTGANNTKVLFNPGVYQLRQGAAKYKELLKETAIIIMNKEEAIQYTESHDKTGPDELLEKLCELGPEIAVITDGSHGSYAFDGEQQYRCPIYPAQRIEATGAGDAYASALVSAVIHGENLETAMKWGTIDSASVIEHIGSQRGLLNLAQIKHKLAEKKI